MRVSNSVSMRVNELPRVKRRWWLLLGTGFVVLGALIGVILLFSIARWWMHLVWCVIGVCLTVPVLYSSVRKEFSVIVTDHLVMFVAAFTLYFLIGASFIVLGPAAAVDKVLGFYSVNATSALRADAVNSLGFGVSLAAAALMPTSWFRRVSLAISSAVCHMSPRYVLVVLAMAGVGAFAYTLVYDFGFRDGIVQGSIRELVMLCFAAVFLAASYQGRRVFLVRLFAYVFASALAIAGLLMFNKTQVLLALGSLVAGLCMIHPVKRVLPIGLVVMVTVYVLIGGMVLYGRSVVSDRAVPLATRLAIVSEGFAASRAGDPNAAASSWARLCYLPAQSAAMDFYDRGDGGDGFSLLPWVFVPRLLAADKPVITDSARSFNEKITGYRTSSTGQGVFSTGYYSGGWPGVVLAALLAGFILAQTSAIARAAMEKRATLLLPLALMGVFIAFRIDGSFLADYAGAFVILLYLMLFLWLVLTPFRRTR